MASRPHSSGERPQKWHKQHEDPWGHKGGGGDGKGRQKGKGKDIGKGKGKTKMGAPSKNGFVFSKTPDGREICFNFNREACDGGCNRVHVCQLCLKSHPRSKCNQVKTQKDEQKS